MRVRTRFDHYSIKGQIGSGGMSQVFSARDESLERDVALKILNRACSRDTKRLSQFEREAEITARISHPNVVKVFTAGRDQGNFYIAMELVGGGSLEDVLQREKKLSQSRVLEIAIQAVEGLKAAHAAGLIHRDLKPGNILLSNEGTAKIVDFGLAMFAREAKGAGEIWATPYYVPPEVLAHAPEDFRSDLYSLTATLYHCATGRPACDKDTASIEQLRAAKAIPVVIKPAEVKLHPELCQMLMRGLKIKPADRYASYDEFLDHLKYCQRQLKRGAKGKPWSGRRQRTLPIWKKTAAAALITAAGVGAWIALHPAPAPVVELAAGPVIMDADPSSVSDSNTSSKFLAAREAMATADFARAREGFASLAAAETTQQPTRQWARFNAGLAALFTGDNAGAAKEFTPLAGPLFSNAPADAPLAAFFQSTAAWLGADRSVDPGKITDCPADSAGAIGLLAGGLKNWNSGDPAGAAKWLDAFARCPESIPSWVKRLQATSAPWREAAVALTSLPDLDPAHASAADAAERSAAATAVLAAIKLPGPAVVKARTSLTAFMAAVEARNTESTDKERQQRLAQEEAEQKIMTSALQRAADLGRGRQFDQAASILRALPLDTPTAKQAAEMHADTWAAAGEFLKQLAADLAREPVKVVFDNATGQPQPSMVSLTGSILHARPLSAGIGGEIVRPLSQTSGATLAAMALSIIQREKDADGFYRRSEMLYWFALRSGLREFAAEHGRSLAQELRPFRAKLDALNGIAQAATQ